MTFLTAKFAPISKAEKLAQEQNDQCHFDHQGINSLIASQNANISRMLEQNSEQIKALTNMASKAELMHQIAISRFDKIDYVLENKSF